MMKNFALTGAAGYIAPRHLKAIKDTGNNLIAAIDPHDSVGILDQYFPDASFFTEIERFDRHIEKLRRENSKDKIDYMTICSPNHLHDAHIRLALRLGADAICEKPLVLNPWNLDALQELESDYGKKVYTILQLRVHPVLVALKQKLVTTDYSLLTTNYSPLNTHSSKSAKHAVELTYITPRGPWYNYSWKGDIQKSGGIATNIGIHLFDLLIWLFGKPVESEVHLSEFNRMSGFLELENANVKWYLSIDRRDLEKIVASGEARGEKQEASGGNSNSQSANQKSFSIDNRHPITGNRQSTFRSIKVDNEEIQFTDGFTDLHTEVYREILAGRGFGIEEARKSVELVARLRKK
jgi:UDP-N-acetyl-2-amino-2-deoxyglucuronate dehydrogenase